MLLEDKRYALQVYNALNHTSYADANLVTIQRLENGIVLSIRNDASFFIDGQLNIYEHQSTFNPNMALRELIYYVGILQPLVTNRDLYSRKQIRIPTPHFCVFYNGAEDRPAEEIFRLSDAFEKAEEHPELEVICRVININPGKNDAFLSRCRVLDEYTQFIEVVNRNRRNGLECKDAVEAAMKNCIEHDILKDFLIARGKEVLEVMTIDMTWERREVLIRKEEREDAEESFKPIIAEKDKLIAEKDNAIAEKNNVIAQKDNIIAQKDAMIATLLAQAKQKS